MSVADTAAVVALVESASTALVGHTFVTRTPDGVQARPYALVHPAVGNDEASRFTGPLTTQHPEFTLHLIGASAAAAQTLLDLVKTKLVVNGFAVAPTVSGRRNSRAWWRSALPIQTDDSVTPWIPYAVVEYGWASDPA